MNVKTCKWVKGCGREAKWQDWCHPHYCKLLRADRIRAGFVDRPDRIRELIRTHRDRGRTIADLARLTDLTVDTLHSIVTGRTERIRVGTADKILAAPLRPSDIGCARRVRALQRLGYSQPAISLNAGVSHRALESATLRGTFPDHLALAIDAAFERLSGTPGPSRRAARKAELAGYAPPIAWEYIAIDNPRARPALGNNRRPSRALGARTTAPTSQSRKPEGRAA